MYPDENTKADSALHELCEVIFEPFVQRGCPGDQSRSS